MTKEDKKLLLKDLCGRLLYGVKIFVHCPESHINNNPFIETLTYDYLDSIDASIDGCCDGIDTMIVKPYLRPMSSMTKEERKELNNQGYAKIAGELYHYCALSLDGAFFNPERHPYVKIEYVIKLLDWLNAHHFDYRGLIKEGLAIEAPKDMYNLNKK